MNKYLLSFLIFSIFNSTLIAQNTNLIQQVFQQLELERKDCKVDLITTSPYPENAEETIVVIPEIVKQEDDYIEMNSHIFIVDSQTGKIKHRYFENVETNDWYSDAIKMTKISIDTLPYHLSSQTVAFGITVHYEGSSQPNPFAKNTFSLFIKKDNSIEQILKNFVVNQFNGEWDTVCDGEFEEKKKSISISKNTTNGFFDLMIENNITKTTGMLDKNEECDFKDIVTKEELTLKYEDGFYQ